MLTPESGVMTHSARAFVAIKDDTKCFVVDLEPDMPVVLGSDSTATIRFSPESVGSSHAILTHVGTRVIVTAVADSVVFVNGKRIFNDTDTQSGDEISIGSASIVVGIVTNDAIAPRRALTHAEFMERLSEEMARAARAGRSTAVAMLSSRGEHGHEWLAIALEQLRAGDVVGTWTPGEIELLLPEASLEVAEHVVARILNAGGDDKLAIGIAVAPDAGTYPHLIIARARAAIRKQRASDAAREDGLVTPEPTSPTELPPVLAEDPTTRRMIEDLDAFATTTEPVLFIGEHGSGCALFARYFVELAAQKASASGKKRSWVDTTEVVECAKLTSLTDVLSTFSARGAVARSAGRTLLLEDVDALDADAQARLFGALEELLERHPSTRVSGTATREVRDATWFHSELASLLATRVALVPPLRERPLDIIPLATYFAKMSQLFERAQQTERSQQPDPAPRFSPAALARLRSHSWPGNVVELRNVMERAITLAHGGEILVEHLPLSPLASRNSDNVLKEHVDSLERDTIEKALADVNYNQTRAAARLGISRRALIYKMEKYGLKPPPGGAGTRSSRTTGARASQTIRVRA